MIVEPDSGWTSDYVNEAKHLSIVLSELIVRIEHVGSTSVPGLPAKPIIDIDVQVPDSSAEETYVPALAAAGYRHTP